MFLEQETRAGTNTIRHCATTKMRILARAALDVQTLPPQLQRQYQDYAPFMSTTIISALNRLVEGLQSQYDPEGKTTPLAKHISDLKDELEEQWKKSIEGHSFAQQAVQKLKT